MTTTQTASRTIVNPSATLRALLARAAVEHDVWSVTPDQFDADESGGFGPATYCTVSADVARRLNDGLVAAKAAGVAATSDDGMAIRLRVLAPVR